MIGVSVGGAAAHNTGQIFAASLVLKSTIVFGYLPVLLFSSLVTGVLTAVASESLFHHMGKLHIFDEVMGMEKMKGKKNSMGHSSERKEGI